MVRKRYGQPPRINDPNDWVRQEGATALQRNIKVIPVLVDGGTLLQVNELPADLQPLLKKQAYEISNKRWRYDTNELIDFLKNTVGITPKQDAAVNPQKKSFLARNIFWLLLIAILLTIIGIQLWQQNLSAKQTFQQTLPKKHVQEEASTTNITGAAVLARTN